MFRAIFKRKVKKFKMGFGFGINGTLSKKIPKAYEQNTDATSNHSKSCRGHFGSFKKRSNHPIVLTIIASKLSSKKAFKIEH
jgi:hypothetical protein